MCQGRNTRTGVSCEFYLASGPSRTRPVAPNRQARAPVAPRGTSRREPGLGKRLRSRQAEVVHLVEARAASQLTEKAKEIPSSLGASANDGTDCDQVATIGTGTGKPAHCEETPLESKMRFLGIIEINTVPSWCKVTCVKAAACASANRGSVSTVQQCGL